MVSKIGLALSIIVSGLGVAQAKGKVLSVECYNAKNSIYVWFCLNQGKLEDKLCEDPHVSFVSEEDADGYRAKSRVLIRKVDFKSTDELAVGVYFSKSEEEPNTLIKVLDIPSAKLTESSKYSRNFEGLGNLTLPKEVEKHLKEAKVIFDLSETYTCSLSN